jgi:hypothetical protein
MGGQHQLRGIVIKMQNLSERDDRTLKRIVSINRRNTAAKDTAEFNIHFEDHLHKDSLMRASQIQHPW